MKNYEVAYGLGEKVYGSGQYKPGYGEVTRIIIDDSGVRYEVKNVYFDASRDNQLFSTIEEYIKYLFKGKRDRQKVGHKYFYAKGKVQFSEVMDIYLNMPSDDFKTLTMRGFKNSYPGIPEHEAFDSIDGLKARLYEVLKGK